MKFAPFTFQCAISSSLLLLRPLYFLLHPLLLLMYVL